MLACGEPTEWQVAAPCRKVGCAKCREKYALRQIAEVQNRFAAMTNEQMASLTIVFAAKGAVDEIADVYEAGRKKLRNLCDAMRRKSDRWADLEIVGWLEVDAVAPEDLDKLPPERRELLDAIDEAYCVARGMPIWIVTMHGIAKLGDGRFGDFEAALSSTWRAPRQTKLRPFHDDKTPDQNIANLVLYALKHDCCSTFWFQRDDGTFGEVDEAWPGSWRAAHYEFIESWSRGFQSTRINIGLRGKKRTVHSPQVEADPPHHHCDEEPLDYIEPMPVLLHEEHFSTFDHLIRLTDYELSDWHPLQAETRPAWGTGPPRM